MGGGKTPFPGKAGQQHHRADAFSRSDGNYDRSEAIRERSRTGIPVAATGVPPTSSTSSTASANAVADSAVYALVVGCGGVVSCAGRDKDVRLLDPSDGQCLERMAGHTDRVWALAKTSDDTLASGSGDRTIKLWRPADAKCLGTFKGHKGAVMSLLAHRGLLISGSQDQSVRLWDLKESGCVGSLWQATDGQASKERNSVHSLAIAKRDQLACGTWGGTIRLWDLHRSRCTAKFDAHSGAVWSMLVADGKLFSAGSDGTVKLWDARQRTEPEWPGSSLRQRCMRVSHTLTS